MTVDLPAAVGSVESSEWHGRRKAALLRNGRLLLGLLLTGSVVLVALFGPLVAPHPPDAFVGAPFQAAGGSAPLGTDYLSHDVLSRVLNGGRNLLWMSLAATVIGTVLGATIGLLAAYSRGLLDTVLMRGMDVILAFPMIVLVLLFVTLLGAKLWLIVLLVGLAWTPQVARVARGAAVEVVQREFVEFSEALGAPRWRILTRDVLPNVTSPLLVDFGLRLTWSIAAIATISFLGFGVQQPNADWGLMINENRNGLTTNPWAVVAPILCIAAFTFGTNLIAEGVARNIAGIDRRGRER